MSVGFSLQAFVQSVADQHHIPGSVAIVFQNGQIVDQALAGYSSERDRIPVRLTTPFMIGGLSKTITFTALLQCLDKGLFRLDEDINQVLSTVGLNVRNPYYTSDPITFRHLLLHESGIRDNWDALRQWYVKGDPTMSLATALTGFLVDTTSQYWNLRNWFKIPPGYSWKYSHVGSALVAYLVELLTATPFNTYCEQNIFAPLEMKNTHWFYKDYGPNISRVAFPHVWSVKKQQYKTLSLYGFADYPDGSLKTSVMDYFNFLTMLMNNGIFNGKTILSQSSVNLMITLEPIHGEYDRQSYGLWRIFKSRSVIGHDGGERGWRSIAGFEPQSKNGIIWFNNAWPRCECMIQQAESIWFGWFGTLIAAVPTGYVAQVRASFTQKLSKTFGR